MFSSKLFTPIVPPISTKPLTQSSQNELQGTTHILTVLKDFLSTPAWLELGAALYIPVYLLLHPIVGSYVLLIPVLAVAYRLATSIAMAKGYLTNPYMADVIPQKIAAVIPDAITGDLGPEPAAQGVCVFLIGAKNNHPLGPLAPGFRELGAHFQGMSKDLEARAEEYGLLSQSSYIEAGGRPSQNQILTVQYYKDSVGLNKFAHGDLHTKGWNWFMKHQKEFPHLAIFHEVFEVPAGNWEGLYLNSKPILMGASAYPVKTDEGTKWYSGLADATKGPLATMKGRMPTYATTYA